MKPADTIYLGFTDAFSHSLNTHKSENGIFRYIKAAVEAVIGFLGFYAVTIVMARNYINHIDNQQKTLAYKTLYSFCKLHDRQISPMPNATPAIKKHTKNSKQTPSDIPATIQQNQNKHPSLTEPKGKQLSKQEPTGAFEQLPGGREVLPEINRPTNREMPELSEHTIAFAKHLGYSRNHVTPEEIENLEYRVVSSESKVIDKIAREKHSARRQGIIEAEKFKEYEDEFLNASGYDESFDNKQAIAGYVKGVAQAPLKIMRRTYDKDVNIYFQTSKKLPHVAAAYCEGARDDMQDKHIATSFYTSINGKETQIEVTGVFDGHGGREMARYAAKQFVPQLKAQLPLFNNPETPFANIWNTLKTTLVNIDRTHTKNYPGLESGTTAVIAIKIGDNKLWIANVGDSRAILFGRKSGVIQLSEDAKPDDKKYTDSINKRGGFVFAPSLTMRVNGELGIARSLGDNRAYFGGAVSARPKITCYDLSDPEDMGELFGQELEVALVCDGLTDVASSEEIAQSAREDLNKGYSRTVASGKLIGRALQNGTQDNVTVVMSGLNS